MGRGTESASRHPKSGALVNSLNRACSDPGRSAPATYPTTQCPQGMWVLGESEGFAVKNNYPQRLDWSLVRCGLSTGCFARLDAEIPNETRRALLYMRARSLTHCSAQVNENSPISPHFSVRVNATRGAPRPEAPKGWAQATYPRPWRHIPGRLPIWSDHIPRLYPTRPQCDRLTTHTRIYKVSTAAAIETAASEQDGRNDRQANV